MENILSVMTGLVIGAVGSYLIAYSKKKGENLATKEDIQALSDQTAILTRTAKEIEAQVSNKIWDRQRHWEMKRDAIFAAVQALGRADDALLELSTVYTLTLKEGEAKWQEKMTERKNAWSERMNKYDEKRFAAELVCSQELSDAFKVAGTEIRLGARRIFKETIGDYVALGIPVHQKIFNVLRIARTELGIGNKDMD